MNRKKLALLAAAVLCPLSSAFALSLAWNASSDATSYNVYEHVGSAFNLIGSTSSLTYALGNLSPARHAFVVTAVNSHGESTNSNEVVISGKKSHIRR